MTRILITGGDGDIAKEINSYLSKNKKYKIFFTSRKLKNKNNFYFQDLTKTITIKDKFDILIHTASNLPVNSSENKIKLFNENLQISKKINYFCNKNSIKILFFLSSTSTYGRIFANIVNENTKPFKQDWYALSKTKSENIFLKNNNNFLTICLRLPSVFTLNYKSKKNLIHNIVQNLIKNKPIKVYNPKKIFNNITDVKDVCDVIKKIINSKKIKSGVFNMASSRPIDFLSFTNLLKKSLKSKSKVLVSPKSIKNSYLLSIKKVQKSFDIKLTSTSSIVKRNAANIMKMKRKQYKLKVLN